MGDQRIAIQRVSSANKKAKPSDLGAIGFGRHFSDHFFATEFNHANGWHKTRIEPLRPLRLDPAALCLHYGQQVFEGLKAYRGADNGIYLFRWKKNAERLRDSCSRLVMETIDENLFGRALKSIVLVDRDWIPQDPNCSLYIRPMLIATDPFLGVRPGNEYAFYIIVGPVGAYYAGGVNPVRIWVSEEDIRAARGGLGQAKTAANYAHSLMGQKKAASLGFSQVLWLDAIERRYVEEVGTSNIFFVIKDQLITPPLGGTILPGVTRDSVIQIAKMWGIPVCERLVSIDEVIETAENGDLQESFGTGTAAAITPVGSFSYRGKEYWVNKNQTGPIALRMYEYLIRLQRAEEPDVFGWVERIDQLDIEQLANEV